MARLPHDSQLPTYSAFLSNISDLEDQRLCLYLGREAGLDMAAIVVAAVASVRAREAVEDAVLVESLAWLTHDASQAGALLGQTNRWCGGCCRSGPARWRRGLPRPPPARPRWRPLLIVLAPRGSAPPLLAPGSPWRGSASQRRGRAHHRRLLPATAKRPTDSGVVSYTHLTLPTNREV